MISLHPQENKLRAADNLLPRSNGGLYTRPGAMQVVAGQVSMAYAWMNAIFMQTGGRLLLWANGTLTDFGQQGTTLSVASYQALVSGAVREDRLYIADGINPLWYIRFNGTVFENVPVVNTVLDVNGVPYPLPIPKLLANWNNRLWIGDGSNRIQHCQNEDPSQWNPLWTLEFQGDAKGAVKAIVANLSTLLVSLDNSLWQVDGTSEYNWQVTPISYGLGAIGQKALYSDGNTVAMIAKHGVYVGVPLNFISEDLRELFLVSQINAQVAIEPKRRFLLVFVAGRLFVMHLDKLGQFTEVSHNGLAGVIVLADGWGWFGDDGVWLVGRLNVDDQTLAGVLVSFTTRYDTWEVQPNVNGAGRCLLNRLRVQVSGMPGTTANYQATVDDRLVFWKSLTLSDDVLTEWGNVPFVDSQAWAFRPVWREVSPKLAGMHFRHTIESTNYVEVHAFLPEYRFVKPS